MCISTVDLLEQVFQELEFPAARWQLVAQAELYGADADTHDRLARLPAGTYDDPAQVLARLREGARPTPARHGSLSTSAALAALRPAGDTPLVRS